MQRERLLPLVSERQSGTAREEDDEQKEKNASHAMETQGRQKNEVSGETLLSECSEAIIKAFVPTTIRDSDAEIHGHE